MRLIPLLVLSFACASTSAVAREPVPAAPTLAADDPRAPMLKAVVGEIDRSMGKLKLADNEAPYFIGLQVKQFDTRSVVGRFGALVGTSSDVYRNVLADVRVGSYAFDSTPPPDAFGFDFDFDAGGYEPTKHLPIDDDPRALRTALWLVIDEQYKRALSTYLKKRGGQVYKPDEPDRAPSFSQELPVTWVGEQTPFDFDRKRWEQEVRRITARLVRPGLFDGEMRVSADKVVRWFASSEGSRIVSEQVMFGLHVNAYTRADDGMLLENSRDFYAPTEAGLPSGKALEKEVDQLIAELEALRVAPVVDPFTGPALLSPEATGVLFHEAVGHRLEGERQFDNNEGRTFKGQIGRAILPDFVNLYDDPTLATWKLGEQVVPLNGFYRYDEQGVPAARASLVENGVLKAYLLSRSLVTGFEKSNGHGRSASNRRPVARMANLVVEPTKTVPEAELKKLLLEEVRRQGKPYGIYIKDITGGNTNTSSMGYQAFKGTSRLVYRVHADDGREELVRGVELVGTPLSSVNRILAMGDRMAVFNGFCGAESGYVPVSAIAPATLVGEFELQRTHKDYGRLPILPAPPK